MTNLRRVEEFNKYFNLSRGNAFMSDARIIKKTNVIKDNADCSVGGMKEKGYV